MDTLWLALRSDLRRKWRALVSLALLLGLAGGVVLTAAAGARRTDTAYPRLLNWANAAQLDVLPGAVVPPYFAALSRISQVTAMSSAIQYNLGLPASGGGFPDTELEAFASADDTFGVLVDRVKMLQGAMFDPGVANQVVIDPAPAAMEHLRPGGMLRMTGIPYGPLSQGAEPDLAFAFPLWFRVTGIALFDDQVVPTTATNEQPRVLLTPAFSQTGAAGSTMYLPTAGLRLRPSLLAAALTSAGPVTSGVGVRMAFEPGHRRTAVPVRSALAGSVIALAALVAAAVFGASLAGLVGTPHRYGDNWDAELNIGFAGVSGPFFGTRVAPAVPAIIGYAAGNTGQVTVDGMLVPAIGVDQVRGSGYLTLLAGRPPAGPDQIVLGAQTLRALHRAVGQTVRVAVTVATGKGGAGAPRVMRVVGAAVFPDFGLPGFSDTDLGSGALVATPLLSETMPETGCTGGATCYNFFLLRYRPGTDAVAAGARLLATVQRRGCPFSACTMTSDQRPGDIRDYATVRDIPLVLAAVLALLAVGTLAHVLLTGVRRRRRDLAVLKTLGWTRSQVHGMVAWEASALAAAALLAGIPLGVIAGRWAWAVFADATGVASQATVDLPLVLLAIPVTLLLANVIAAWPGWTAARPRPRHGAADGVMAAPLSPGWRPYCRPAGAAMECWL